MAAEEVPQNHALAFLLRSAIAAVALLFVAAFVPLLFGWKPAIIASGSMQPSLHPGDVVMINKDSRSFQSGQVITFDRHGQSITHRIVRINGDGTIQTRGDANGTPDNEPVRKSDVTGRVGFVVPMVGLPALHPQYILLFVVLTLGHVTRKSAPTLRRVDIPSIKWGPNAERFAMASILSVVATTCVGTTITSSLFTSSTANGSNSFSAKDGYFSSVVALNPQSYWRLGETSGTTAVDTQGLLAGTFAPANVTYGVTAPLTNDNNKAITCTAGTTCFSTADHVAFHNTGAQSIALWFKPSTASQSTNARVFAKYDGTNITYFVAYDATSGRMRYLVDVNSRVTALSSTLITNTNNWYFIAGTWDGTTARIYINGVAEGTGTGTGPVKQNNVGFAALANVGGTAGARGSLDDLAVWDRVLTPAEISTLYARGTT